MKRIITILLLAFTVAAASAFAWQGFTEDHENLQAKISGAEISPEIRKEKTASIMFFGDIMLDRRVYNLAKESGDWGYPFKDTENLFGLADANVANLEGPITSFDSESAETNGMRFTINPSFVPELKKRFSALSLANNHTLDFGEEGLRQTKKNLSGGEITFFGDYENRGDNVSAVIAVNGVKLGLVGYHSLSGKNFNNAILDIKKLKETSDFVVVMPHWGNEYELFPSENQKNEARLFIDAGADAVIGGHPHVIQPAEIYKGKAIFYSLGNFVFDQYFSESVMKGLAIRLEIKMTEEGTKPEYEIIPIENNKLSQPTPMENGAAGTLIDLFAANSAVSDKIKEEIRLFHRIIP
jgi:poly-gamma-glutamate synthesis protein (capsule biosynthesis protein)